MKLSLLALMLFVMCVVVQLEAMSFLTIGLMGLGILLVMLGSLGLLVAGWIKHSRWHALRGLALAFLFLASMIVGCAVQAAQVRASKLRGDRVCAALEAYRHRLGVYPSRLSALVPIDLPHFPVTAMGVLRTFEFHYAIKAPCEFDLSFAEPLGTGWRRGSTTEWTWFD